MLAFFGRISFSVSLSQTARNTSISLQTTKTQCLNKTAFSIYTQTISTLYNPLTLSLSLSLSIHILYLCTTRLNLWAWQVLAFSFIQMAIPYPHFIDTEKAAMDAGLLLPSSSRSPSVIFTQDDLKKIAAYKAVEYVESGMVLGLGTGSTAKHAVNRIGELLRQGKLKDIVGIPTSKITHEQALSLGIPLSDLDSHPVVDLAIDGADEVDPFFNLVKGRGGSLLREKMVESACKKFIVIVDESKLVNYVGGSGLAMPVEVIRFCWKFTAERLRKLFEEAGCVAKLRTVGEKEEPYVTDNGNFIVDLYFKRSIGDLKVASDAILHLAGVVEHGMFLDMATTVIVAGELGLTVKNK
ncbi:hypothetical protein LR48_Vigan609s002300 [Vigna angularis]|uniref:ribose-5-phosphate isomerase n=3 Tax=Phaseolus angularis TaxID=3914 RepID=A0A0L9TEQ9_PHAAN|nr:hypothetical protein LR48_Vigan609s002300 [Vigna angularis]